VAARVSEARPDLIEVNVSCPNVSAEFGRPFALDPAAAAEATAAVKAAVGSLPVLVKLSPNVTSIVEIARAVVAAGADGLTLINTVGPGLVIDVDSGRPVLSNREGGLSGPAIRPIAVRCVYDVSRALPEVPIVGTGGVMSGRDAVEMIMAGATAVGIGSAVYWHGPEVFARVAEEMATFMVEHGYERLADLRGIAHG
jgi:dihydroorotate dehydrogenase (NAD+) catalytic subunit